MSKNIPQLKTPIWQTPLFWVIILGVTLRIAMALATPPDPSKWADAGTYHALAVHMLAGDGFTMDGETPSRVRTPGYSVFLALIYVVFGANPTLAVVIQALICSVTIYVVYCLTRHIFDHRTATLAALMTATYPALIYYDTRLLREGITTTLLAITVYIALRYQGQAKLKHAGYIGMLLAAVSMIRPETILVGIPVIYLMYKPQINIQNLWRPALLVALPIALVWVPWTARNYAHFGSLSPITAGIGSTMWFGNQWSAIGGEDRKKEDHSKLQAKTSRILNENITSGNEANVDRTFTKMVIEDLKTRPSWFLSMIGNKAILFWKDANGVKKTLPNIHPLLALGVNIYYYFLLMLALVSLTTKRGRELALVVFTYMAIYAILHVRNRYRVPILPLVLILSSGGFAIIWNWTKERLALQTHKKPHNETIQKQATG